MPHGTDAWVVLATLFAAAAICPAYAIVPRGRVSPLDDQSWAGLIMWVPGSLVFLVAAVGIALETLASGAPAGAPSPPDEPMRRTVLSSSHPV